jgi:hypothetical protein
VVLVAYAWAGNARGDTALSGGGNGSAIRCIVPSDAIGAVDRQVVLDRYSSAQGVFSWKHVLAWDSIRSGRLGYAQQDWRLQPGEAIYYATCRNCMLLPQSLEEEEQCAASPPLIMGYLSPPDGGLIPLPEPDLIIGLVTAVVWLALLFALGLRLR